MTQLYEQPTELPQTQGRILLISYLFGTNTNTGGFRWNAMVRDLIQKGWSFDIITCPDWDSYPYPSFKVYFPINSNVNVYSISSKWWGKEARRLSLQQVDQLKQRFQKKDELESQKSLPALKPEDACVWTPEYRRTFLERVKTDFVGTSALATEWVWTQKAMRQAFKLAAEHPYEAVVVTSPLYLPQIIGAKLAQKYDIPYIADFRNLWCYGYGVLLNFMDDVQRFVGYRYEWEAIQHAKAIIHITERARDAHAEALQGRINPQRYYIPNGYNELADIADPDPNCFRVVYTGWTYPFTDLRPLLAACGRLQKRWQLSPDKFQVQLMGTDSHLGQVPYADLAQAYGIEEHFQQMMRQPREKSTQLQQQASVLVATDYPHGRQIPSKLYHYAQMKGRILLIGNVDGAMADEGAKVGLRVYAPNDDTGIDTALDVAFQAWRRGELTTPTDQKGIFDSRHASAKMHEVLLSVSNETSQ